MTLSDMGIFVSFFDSAEGLAWERQYTYDEYVAEFKDKITKVVDRQFYEDVFEATTAYYKRYLVEQGIVQQ